MQTIDNYINERLNPRHLGSTSIIGKFPAGGTITEVTKFLKNNGFKELELPKAHSNYDHYYYINDYKGRCYVVDSLTVFFADSSEYISNDNPIFCYYKNSKDILYHTQIYNKSLNMLQATTLKEQKFLEEINQCFNK